MLFVDRQDAGTKLAKKFIKYKGKDIIVYALPRGGVVTASEVAKFLKAPLDIIITRKIGHQFNPEYAIAAISQSGQMVGNPAEIEEASKVWFEKEIENQKYEIERRKELYLKGRGMISSKGKVAILIDDGVATGLTLRAGISELRHLEAGKVIVGVPIAPKSSAEIIEDEADQLITLETIPDEQFSGAVGSYYEDFRQVEDNEVIDILASHNYQNKY